MNRKHLLTASVLLGVPFLLSSTAYAEEAADSTPVASEESNATNENADTPVDADTTATEASNEEVDEQPANTENTETTDSSDETPTEPTQPNNLDGTGKSTGSVADNTNGSDDRTSETDSKYSEDMTKEEFSKFYEKLAQKLQPLVDLIDQKQYNEAEILSNEMLKNATSDLEIADIFFLKLSMYREQPEKQLQLIEKARSISEIQAQIVNLWILYQQIQESNEPEKLQATADKMMDILNTLPKKR
ncbi:hypothetical protein NHG29_07380 [Aerococcaceae bacterium NML160702]|nr:hypothetical protein [Aerococcaceae bacterium NML160702]